MRVTTLSTFRRWNDVTERHVTLVDVTTLDTNTGVYSSAAIICPSMWEPVPCNL